MRALFPIAQRYADADHAAIALLAILVRSTIDVFLANQVEALKLDARRYEKTASNCPGILGMGAGVGYELLLKPGRPPKRSGIVSFRHGRALPADYYHRLREAGITSDTDLDRLPEALLR